MFDAGFVGRFAEPEHGPIEVFFGERDLFFAGAEFVFEGHEQVHAMCARLRLTLANGQVWDQVEAVPSFQPRAGDPITVRQASLGSYLLRGRVGAPVRARRVR